LAALTLSACATMPSRVRVHEFTSQGHGFRLWFADWPAPRWLAPGAQFALVDENGLFAMAVTTDQFGESMCAGCRLHFMMALRLVEPPTRALTGSHVAVGPLDRAPRRARVITRVNPLKPFPLRASAALDLDGDGRPDAVRWCFGSWSVRIAEQWAPPTMGESCR
jgi:hypothetical protein